MFLFFLYQLFGDFADVRSITRKSTGKDSVRQLAGACPKQRDSQPPAGKPTKKIPTDTLTNFRVKGPQTWVGGEVLLASSFRWVGCDE